MSNQLNTIWQYLRAFVLIYACLYMGFSSRPCYLSHLTIIGMLILFVLLALQVLPAKWVQPWLLRSHSLHGATVLSPLASGSCNITIFTPAVRPHCRLLRGQYAGGFPGGELEFASGAWRT